MYDQQYESYRPSFDVAAQSAVTLETLAEPAAVEAATDEAGREADPYDVINFLLKKSDEQQARLQEQEGYMELQTQEIDQLKARVDAMQQEIEQQLADYEILMQNALATEKELEGYKQKVTEKPTIKLPFYAEEKLAKLGYGAEAVEIRQAV